MGIIFQWYPFTRQVHRKKISPVTVLVRAGGKKEKADTREEHGLRIFTYVHTVFESCYMIAIHMIDFGTIPLPSITFEVQKIVSAVCVVYALCLRCVCTLVCSCLHFVCIGLHQIADNAPSRSRPHDT